MKDPLAVQGGRKGGLKGGPARAAKLSPERRSAIAAKAANARWGKTNQIQPDASMAHIVAVIREEIATIENKLERHKTALNIIEACCLRETRQE